MTNNNTNEKMDFTETFEIDNFELPLLTNENCPFYNNWNGEEIAKALHTSLQSQDLTGWDILTTFLKGSWEHPHDLEGFSMGTFIMVISKHNDNTEYPLFSVSDEIMAFFWSTLDGADMDYPSIGCRLNNNELNLASFPKSNWG